MKSNTSTLLIEKDLKNKSSKKSSKSKKKSFMTDELNDSLELQTTIDISPNVELLEADRHAGHNNFTAIRDFVDNPMDPDVNANNVWVDIIHANDKYIAVRIADDGSGISPLNIDQVLKYGSRTGRNKRKYLGGYGRGINTAGLSMGKNIEIRTKSDNGPFFIVEFDYDEIKKSNTFIANKRIGTSQEYLDFIKTLRSETGTIVTVSKLDRMKNDNIKAFINNLRWSLGLSHYYFISKYKKHIFVNNQEVIPIDPISRHLPEIDLYADNIDFQYNDHNFTFSVYNIRRISQARSREIGRNKPNAGMYIFRNERLVGEGLDLGIVGLSEDGHGCGIRIEFFMDGECDELFGSTSIKVIKELNKDEVDQSFRKACKAVLRPYISDILTQEDKSAKKRREEKNNGKVRALKTPKIKQKKEKVKNAFLDDNTKGFCLKKTPLDIVGKRVEETIAIWAGTKVSQKYGAEYEKLIRDLSESLFISPTKDNAGDSYGYSKSTKFNLFEQRDIVTKRKIIYEKKMSILDVNGCFAIDRIKPTQKIDKYLILLVDVIYPNELMGEVATYIDGEMRPKDFVGYFYCIPASYIEKSNDLTRYVISGTKDANKNNHDPELKITVKKEDALKFFGEYNELRGTSITDLLEHLKYLNNDDGIE